MAFQVSPGVLVQERDLTRIIPAVSTSIGAFAGEFRKDDNEILEKIIREGVVSTAFLGDLEDACQSGDWNSSETIMAKIFLASAVSWTPGS